MSHLRSDVEHLTATWDMAFPNVESPGYAQWAYWIRRYGFFLVQTALVRLERRYNRRSAGEFDDAEELHRFTSTMLRQANVQAEQDGQRKASRRSDEQR